MKNFLACGLAALAALAVTARAAEPAAEPVPPAKTETAVPAVPAPPPAVRQKVAVYSLKSLSAEEAEMVVKMALSPSGKVGPMPAKGKLIICDAPENVAMILSLLREADPEPVNVRVEVTFSEVAQAEVRELGVRGGGVVVRSSGGHTSVSGGAVIGARDSRTDSSGMTSQSVLTRSGSAANIWVGRTVAEPAWTFEYGCGRGWWRKDYVWQELGASLWVRPVAQSDGTIDLEVFPRVTARGPEPLSVDVKELSTHVRVADGVPVAVGGLTQSQREVFTRLLGTGGVFNGSSLGVTLRATVVKPRRPPPAEEGKPAGKPGR